MFISMSQTCLYSISRCFYNYQSLQWAFGYSSHNPNLATVHNRVLHRAAAYCHPAVYCSKVNVMLNYSRMTSVATDCYKNSSSIFVGNVLQAACDILILFMNITCILKANGLLYSCLLILPICLPQKYFILNHLLVHALFYLLSCCANFSPSPPPWCRVSMFIS